MVQVVMTLTRRPDWRARLAAELSRQREQGFTWGGQDCAIGLAAGVVEALTGEDLAAEWRGTYASPREALKALRKAGYESLGDLVAAKLPEHDSLLRARPGDIGLLKSDGPVGEALGVIDVTTVYVLTEAGHGHRPKSDLIRAFRVGES